MQSIENAIKSGASSSTANAAAITSLTTRVTALENPVNPVTSFVSSGQTITALAALTLPHGLGSTPTRMTVCLVCQSTDAGYAAGDIVFVSPNFVDFWNSGTSAHLNLGATVSVDATNVYVTFGAGGTGQYGVNNKTTGAWSWITDAKWLLRVVADL